MSLAPAPHRFARPLVAAFLLAGFLVVAAGLSFLGGRWDADPVLDATGWRTVATVDDVRLHDVVYIPQLLTFLVAVPDDTDGATAPGAARELGLIALLDDANHIPGDRVYWCPDPEVFWEKNHGSKFDRFGAYMDGPAMRGLDRVAVRVVGDEVQIDPDRVEPGPDRGSVPVRDPRGPLPVGGPHDPDCGP
ncbi:MAG TPA: hypothetical protein VGB51_03295 [Actinomycetota bacterium]